MTHGEGADATIDCTGDSQARVAAVKSAHRFKLDEAAEAYKLFDTQTTGKGVFIFD